MKKSQYRELVQLVRRGETPRGGWGRAFKWQSPGSKLARKAAEGMCAGHPVGIVGKALETIARNRRAA